MHQTQNTAWFQDPKRKLLKNTFQNKILKNYKIKI
jgi:hypothetical protein